jgi:hypothetical protein
MATKRKTPDVRATRRASSQPAAKATGDLIESAEVAVDPVPQIDTARVVKAAFKDDTKVRAEFSKQYRERANEAAPRAQKAERAFKEFKPSLFDAREREPRTYLAPGENLAAAQNRIVKRGVEDMRAASDQRSLKLRLSDEVKALVTKTPGDNGTGTLVLTELLNLLNAKLPGAPSLRDDPAFTACAAKAEAQRRLDAIEGKPPAKSPAPPAPAADVPANGDHEPSQTKDFVKKHVHDLMALMPSPEEQPLLVPYKRDELDVVHASIQNLELRSGASDVTSYHDFNSLQIAFEHVWAEVFDTRLGQLGRELYETYIELADFTGYDPSKVTSVTSLDDIATLVDDATQLGRVIDNATPPTGISQEVLDAFNQVRSDAITKLAAYVGSGPATDFVDGVLGPLKAQIDRLVQSSSADNLSKALPSVTRLKALLTEIADLLTQPYAFTVFHKGSSNFGIMVTYRQTWVPEQYQVGDLVSTIPMAPRETWRYTTKQVTKKSRTTKEVENNLQANKTGADETARADREIVARAESHTNFKATADGSFGTDAYKIHATAEGGGDTGKFSQDTKKDFHEAVLKSAQEYKHDNRMEVEASTSEETESTTFHEIQNPNDELTVTYLFYELQRTYRISERIQQVIPVVLVANEVPAPNKIDDAWLVKNDWILRRVLLDDSFRPALDYLTKSFVGDELNLQILDSHAKAQRQVVDDVKAQVAAQLSIVAAAQSDLSTKMDVKGGLEFAEGILGTVKHVFDPFQLTGSSVTGTKEGLDTVANYAQETLDRAEREKARLLDQLAVATSALQVAVDKLSTAIREHYDKVTEVDRLRIHVKENILYYMQAIWNHEPPDQRYFRVFQTKIPVVQPKSTNVNISVPSSASRIEDTLTGGASVQVQLPVPEVEIEWKTLVEIAELDEVLGYKGNYAIYRLKENNYLTLHMMQDYLEVSDEVTIRDPDDVANYTVDDLQKLATCLYEENKKTFHNKYENQIRQLIIDRLTSGRAEDDRVIVPTKSLYIEALVGTHTLLEDFKLLHRALDVKKVQAETRHVELENVRLAARALKGNDEDPDIEKKIIIENGSGVVLPTD